MIIINNSGGITMRKPEEIRADIEKLTKELEVVKIHEAKQSAAVHILYNLGWKHDPRKGWQKPEPKRDWKEFDKDTMTHVKAGDYVKLGGAFGYGYVRSVSGRSAKVSRVIGVTHRGARVLEHAVTVSVLTLKVVSCAEVQQFFKIV